MTFGFFLPPFSGVGNFRYFKGAVASCPALLGLLILAVSLPTLLIQVHSESCLFSLTKILLFAIKWYLHVLAGFSTTQFKLSEWTPPYPKKLYSYKFPESTWRCSLAHVDVEQFDPCDTIGHGKVPFLTVSTLEALYANQKPRTGLLW